MTRDEAYQRQFNQVLELSDLLLVVATPGQAVQAVGRRVLATARQVGMAIETTWTIFNQTPTGYRIVLPDAGNE
jgi:hypothetical protein